MMSKYLSGINGKRKKIAEDTLNDIQGAKKQSSSVI